MARTVVNFKSQYSLLLFATIVCAQLVAGANGADANERIVTVTLDGRHRIRGQTLYSIYENQPFVAFRGVPYAEAPVGHLRFKPPVPKKLPHTLDAFSYGSVCSQLFNNQFVQGSEDCLFLNVFTPAIIPNRQLAVIVYLHGGGFTAGGIDGGFTEADFLLEKDVILVTLNYRVNSLGFMSLGNDEYAGNMGLKDQQFALRWVQRHIRQFGGDPRKVTLLGASAGAASVHLQMLAPSSKGLFQRAILMSGTAGSFWAVASRADHREQMMNLALRHNASVNTFAELVEWLHRAPVATLLEQDNSIQVPDIGEPGFEFTWAPVVSNGTDRQPFEVQRELQHVVNYESDLDVLFGYNNDEMVGFFGEWFGNNARFENLDNNFNIFLPFKTWGECRNATAYAEVMSAIRQFYFGNATITVDAFPQLIALMSDIQSNHGVDQSVRHQTAHSTGDTFYYRISANTTLNVFKRLTNTTPLLLTSHIDELCYFFRCLIIPNLYENLLPDSIERRVQSDLLNLWSNFAKFGKPAPQDTPIIFAPISADSHHLVDIGNDGVTLVPSPNGAANDFWYSLYEHHSPNFQLPC